MSTAPLKHLVAAISIAGALTPAAAGAAIPPRTDIRCVVTDVRPTCGFFASGPSRFHAGRVGPWVVRVYREGRLVWSTGAHTPTEGWIPSLPGDKVEGALGLNDNLCPIYHDPRVPKCRGAGALVLSELIAGPL